MNEAPTLAVIGGSGLYEMPGLQNTREQEIATPFGKPSAPIIVGMLEGYPIAFLSRHGIGHHISPSEINFRANIYALKSLGIERIVSISACGSLREDFRPGEVVIPDQLFDFTVFEAPYVGGEHDVEVLDVLFPGAFGLARDQDLEIFLRHADTSRHRMLMSAT